MQTKRDVNPVVMLEFNELTPSLMDRFIADGDLPTFARFRAESRVYLTEAEERAPYLEPWIQWVTVHSGLNYRDHGIFNLNEGHKLEAPRTWDLLSQVGYRVWVCGSMNVRYENGLNGHALPDPWCTKTPPHPDDLSLYFRFVQQQVLEHSNEQMPMTMTQYRRFLAFMVTHGLSPQTVIAILRQLLEERTSNTRWKRAVLLDMLQFDVFKHYYRRLQPHFATFFLNSTAHYQHAYWDSMEPEAFASAPAADDRAPYREAIRYGYQRMDGLLARLLRVVGPETTVILCTALSQEAWVDHSTEGGGSFYRPHRFEAIPEFAGVADPCTASPVMCEQFFLDFQSTAAATRAAEALKSLRVGAAPALVVRSEGARIFAGCGLHDDLPQDAAITNGRTSRPFHDLFYKLQTTKSGKHHPEGLFWIRQPDRRHCTVDEKVPLGSVAPTVLRYFGLQPPPHMRYAAVPL